MSWNSHPPILLPKYLRSEFYQLSKSECVDMMITMAVQLSKKTGGKNLGDAIELLRVGAKAIKEERKKEGRK